MPRRTTHRPDGRTIEDATDDTAGEDALTQFARALADPSRARPEIGTLDRARAVLGGYAKKKFPALQHQDLPDIVSQAVSRVLGKIQPDRNPVGYLLRAVESAALDHLRAAGRRPVEPAPLDELERVAEHHLTDDQAIAAIDADLTAYQIEDVLRDLAERNETTLFRVLGYMLDEAQATGAAPSDRAVAAAVGLSHTAVANARRRLQAYLHPLR